VAFHETFWVVTGTAAPVIALAAVVSLGEAFGQRLDSDDAGFDVVRRMVDVPDNDLLISQFHDFVKPAMAAGRWCVGLLVTNVAIQSALLALSLVSIDSQANAVPPRVADVAAVLGVAILAVVAGLLLMGRASLRSLQERVRFDSEDQAFAAGWPTVDDVSDGPGDPSAQPSQG